MFSHYFTVNFSVLDENGEESDEPPIPVVKEIKEKDAFYSKKYTSCPVTQSLNTSNFSHTSSFKLSFCRCKLFYKKDGEFKEKGVGTLHLKMVAESKLQLLVRADTNLGNCLHLCVVSELNLDTYLSYMKLLG